MPTPTETRGFRVHAGRTLEEVLATLGVVRENGLTHVEAAHRLASRGVGHIRKARGTSVLALLVKQVASPLTGVLVFAAAVSFATHSYTDAAIVLGIVVLSALLSFAQEYRATRAVAALTSRITRRSLVLRDGRVESTSSDSLVVGDLVMLSAGSLVPADAIVIASKDCLVDEAILTGESFPASKLPSPFEPDTPLARCAGVVFAGTNVRSGTATVLVVAVGSQSEIGSVARHLERKEPETEFERGLREFGTLVSKVVALLVGGVFVLNVLTEKAPVDALLFAIAIAVGMAPELLPAVVTLTIARGARHMAERGVIVRRLSAIENLGSMDVLCTDKTGTLTEGVVSLEETMAPDGSASERPLELAYVNAFHEAGFANPLDEAIRSSAHARKLPDPTLAKLDEIPYDFVRKRLGIVYAGAATPRLVLKGAFAHVLEACSHVRFGDDVRALDDDLRNALRARADAAATRGLRALGVADGVVPKKPRYEPADETNLVFEGFLFFSDPPKRDVAQVLRDLHSLGVTVKIITGDSLAAATHLAERIGLRLEGALASKELAAMSDQALLHRAQRTTLFAEVDPNQKERIILALRHAGHCVGYMGDGINDAPALHAADVGVSVESAVDIARESADFVLLRRDLAVLRDGIKEGRRTFANTTKYIYATTSANFGNMLSLAGASAFLPFLPLLAKQILLNNFLSDVPAMTIATDSVDPESVARPRRFDIGEIRRFMLVFGAVSSAFDYLTFYYLRSMASLTPDGFRTGWFVESLLTELLIVFVVRTRRPLLTSRPSRALLGSTIAVGATVVALPYTPFASLFSLTPLSLTVMSAVVGVSVVYAIVSELTKHWFWRTPEGGTH